MHIDSYKFGLIVIDGVEYTNDVMITPTQVRGNWRRVNGHEFSVFDLAILLEHPPKRLILGTGVSGQCRVLKEVVDYCTAMKVELIVKSTPEAVVEYNSLEDKSSTAVALHLTC